MPFSCFVPFVKHVKHVKHASNSHETGGDLLLVGMSILQGTSLPRVRDVAVAVDVGDTDAPPAQSRSLVSRRPLLADLRKYNEVVTLMTGKFSYLFYNPQE